MWTRRRRWRHSLPLTAFTLITAGLQVHWKKTWHWVPLKAALALEFNCPSLPRTWLNHCRWNWTATRSLGFTTEDWLATVSSLWASFSWCMKMSAMIAPGRACSLTNHCQGRIAGADCQLLKKKLTELITLPRWMWRSLDCLLELRKWLWLSLVTETEYDILIFDALFWSLLCWLMYWSLRSRFTEDSITCTLHHAWWALFSWLQTVFITDLQVFRSLHACTGLWHWFTKSMSRGSAKIHALCPHHCALHGTVKHTHCLAQVTVQKGWLSWLRLLTVSCTGERSRIFSVWLFLFFCFFGLGGVWFDLVRFVSCTVVELGPHREHQALRSHFMSRRSACCERFSCDNVKSLRWLWKNLSHNILFSRSSKICSKRMQLQFCDCTPNSELIVFRLVWISNLDPIFHNLRNLEIYARKWDFVFVARKRPLSFE